jgi:hypothetical protein
VPRQPRCVAVLALVPAFVFAAGIAPAGAQPEPPRFELVPRAGVLAPLVDLGRATDINTNYQVKVELDMAFAAGLTVQYNPAYLPVSFRLVADYAPFNVTTTGQLAVCQLIEGDACAKVPVDARYLAVAADAVLRAGQYEQSSFYLVAGLGIKRYDFAELRCDAEDPEDPLYLVCNLLGTFAQDQVDPMVHLGLGFSFRVGRARLELEFADFMTTYRAEGEDVTGAVQQDIVATLGLRLGIP